jgi:hypothetical protein
MAYFKKMPWPSGIPESRYPANTGKKTPLQVNIAEANRTLTQKPFEAL